MHLPFGPETRGGEEHAELPEVVPIEQLSSRAIDEAAREIEHEQELEEEAPEWPTPTG